jgi:hypothetical protein
VSCVTGRQAGGDGGCWSLFPPQLCGCVLCTVIHSPATHQYQGFFSRMNWNTSHPPPISANVHAMGGGGQHCMCGGLCRLSRNAQVC